MAPIIAAARRASPVRMELMSHRFSIIVPQSPGATVAMWISQPNSARRISVPAHWNSASSGWAINVNAVFFVGKVMVPSETPRESQSRHGQTVNCAGPSRIVKPVRTKGDGPGRGRQRSEPRWGFPSRHPSSVGGRCLSPTQIRDIDLPFSAPSIQWEEDTHPGHGPKGK